MTYRKKNYVEFELVYVLNEKTEFYPLGYIFYHTEEVLSSHFRMTGRDTLIRDLNFDFEKYSYLYVQGRKIKKMYYGYETSKIYDISPSYGKTPNTIFVHIEYEEGNDNTGPGYIYKCKRNPRFRGLNGM